MPFLLPAPAPKAASLLWRSPKLHPAEEWPRRAPQPWHRIFCCTVSLQELGQELVCWEAWSLGDSPLLKSQGAAGPACYEHSMVCTYCIRIQLPVTQCPSAEVLLARPLGDGIIKKFILASGLQKSIFQGSAFQVVQMCISYSLLALSVSFISIVTIALCSLLQKGIPVFC